MSPSPSSRLNLYLATFFATLTSALFGYTVGLIGGLIVLPSFLEHFGLSTLSPQARAAAQSQIVTVWLVGALFGVPLGIPICARWGRRMCLAQCAALYLLGAGLQLAGGSLVRFECGRFVNGLGVGVGTLVGPMYISEVSPPSHRGMIMSGYQTLLQISALVGFWGAYAANALIPNTSSLQWQVLIIVQLIPGVILLLGTYLVVPETPQYLASRKRWDAVTQSLAWLRSLPEDDPDLVQEAHDIHVAAELQEKMHSQQSESFFKEAMRKPIRKRLLVGIGLMIAQNMVGLNALNYYAPVIFMSAGFTSVSSSLFLTGLFGIVKLISAIAFMFVFVRIRGNRFWLKLGSTICGVSMVVLAYCVRSMRTTPSSPEASGLSPRGAISVLMVYIFAFAFGVSLGPISWNVCAEIFPLHINAKCCAITTCTQWLFQIVIAGITPRLIATVGWRTYVLYAVFCFLSLVWVIFSVPETRGVPLGKAMDALFDDTGGPDATISSSEPLVESVIDDDDRIDEYTALLHQEGERNRRRSSFAGAI